MDRLGPSTLRKLYFHFLSYWMGYDRGDGFPFDFEPNINPFGSKSKGKPSPRSYTIQFERKLKYSFFSVLTGVDFRFLPNCKEYYLWSSWHFSCDYKPNRIPFGS